MTRARGGLVVPLPGSDAGAGVNAGVALGERYGKGCQLVSDPLSYTPFTPLPVFIRLVRFSLGAATARKIMGFLP
jgi:hypothetical protein